MTRLTSLLERAMYKSPLTPILVKTSDITGLKPEISSLLSVPLRDNVQSLFPRLTGFGNMLREIKAFNILSFPASQLIIEELAQNKRVEKIYLDRPLQLLDFDVVTKKFFTPTSQTRKLIGADKANAAGFTGKNITLIVIDTGGTRLHRQTTHMQVYTTLPGIYSDANGHGEHVASIAGGKLAKDPVFNVECEGMAPDANLISIKALGYILGVGKDSDALEALDLAYQFKSDVINLSMGASEIPDTPQDDVMVEVIDKLTNAGIIVVCAAGNNGPKSETINSPGTSKNAITVGAWDTFSGNIPNFSSRGPAWDEIKPDIVAPGVSIYSALTGILDIQSDKREQRYGYLSGTSMSTPHIAGLLACVKQMFNEAGIPLNSDVVKTIFQQYGTEKDNIQGHGLINWEWFMDYVRR